MSQPLNISVASAIAKSRRASADPWVPLVKIAWLSGDVTRLASNSDDVVYDAGDGAGPQTFTRFHWEFDELDETSDGSVPTWKISLSNVKRQVEQLLDGQNGGVGAAVTVYVVNANKLNREPDLEMDWIITSSGSDSMLVNLTLGAESPFRTEFLRHEYTPDTCQWIYKSGPMGCPYSGPLPTCALNRDDCRNHFPNQPLPILAFPGVNSNGIRVVSK